MINVVKDMKYIRKITNKQILYIITLLILCLIPLTKLLGFYLQKYNVISSYNVLNASYIIYITIPFQVYLYYKALKVSNNKPNIIDILINILILSTLTSSITALEPKIAFLGSTYRYEGFFVILGYYLLMLNWMKYTKKDDIKRIIKIILIITIIHCIYGLFQEYTKFSFILRYTPNKEMISGLAFNPNFLGSLLVTSLGITSSIYLINDKYKKILICLTILFSLSLINVNSTGPLLTYIIILLLLPIYLLKNKQLNLKKYIILISITTLTFGTTLLLNKTIFKIDTCELCGTNKNNSIVKKDEAETIDVSNGRLEIWRNSFNIIKQYPITGIGYDNFYIAYHNGKYYKIVFETDENGHQTAKKVYYDVVDNPHNVYLNVLVSTGILGFIPYMLLLLITFIICLKKKNIILLTAFVAYSIQAFANINVMQVAPIYFILIGLILSESKELITR